MVASGEERVCLEARRHPVVLAGPFLRALALGGAGGALVALGWPLTVPGALALTLAALIALRAVWRWERTRLIVTTEQLLVVHGTLRRRSAAVPLARVGALEVEQGVLGRLLGYGTLVAGNLEIPHVAEPRRLCRLVARLGT